ncbi:Pr6Pr family membrane protein [Leptolyngbya sp. CCNP1308]|uniref:Pr6Pr family membrane protein n=1 Tax=Leptolyngbya sp. CCNP1308 TaxID=3110255 RepID=UPI002B1FA0AB|nr:Pr6Pr family membrane protein [Leptolyngbya sp. CCNP1308]MEA5450215.1 Pr6Pr family membrane protein [Leptolyngbya sp. CCNP1308]
MLHSSDLRRFATLSALVGWFALAAQFYLSVRLGIVNGNGVLGGIVAYLSYFTILTNLLAAIALTAGALPDRTSPSWLAFFRRPGVVTAITASIVVVGSVYFLILRHIWEPQGLQLVADVLLHYAMPPLFFVYWWWAVPKQVLRPAAIPRWMAYPLSYAVYALVLGAIRGRYPYPFIDVTALGYPRVLVNSVVILAVFAGLCLALILLGRLDQRRHRAPGLS